MTASTANPPAPSIFLEQGGERLRLGTASRRRKGRGCQRLICAFYDASCPPTPGDEKGREVGQRFSCGEVQLNIFDLLE